MLSSMKTNEYVTYEKWTITRDGTIFHTLQHKDLPSKLFNLTLNAVCDKINSNDLFKTTNQYLSFMKKYELGLIHMDN